MASPHHAPEVGRALISRQQRRREALPTVPMAVFPATMFPPALPFPAPRLASLPASRPPHIPSAVPESALRDPDMMAGRRGTDPEGYVGVGGAHHRKDSQHNHGHQEAAYRLVHGLLLRSIVLLTQQSFSIPPGKFHTNVPFNMSLAIPESDLAHGSPYERTAFSTYIFLEGTGAV